MALKNVKCFKIMLYNAINNLDFIIVNPMINLKYRNILLLLLIIIYIQLKNNFRRLSFWSLLCEKEIIRAIFEDYESYFDILKITKVNFKLNGNPKSNIYFKWTNIVKPLYERMKMELNFHSNDLL